MHSELTRVLEKITHQRKQIKTIKTIIYSMELKKLTRIYTESQVVYKLKLTAKKLFIAILIFSRA